MKGQREGWGGGADMSIKSKVKNFFGLSKSKRKPRRRTPARKKNGEFKSKR
jgi:hypothetical protein